jgi:hypothetical protein
MLIPILGGVGVILVVGLIVVAMQPPTFRVSRSITIDAPPSAVFPHINELRRWEIWSPWAKLDPTMKQTYDGPPAGVGSSTHWIGNRQVGEGRMTIVESTTNERVRIKLEFLKPFKATNQAEFELRPQGEQTAVEWTMTGDKNLIMKAFCMMMNMDKMVGRDFEKGLAAMKAEVEKG